MTYRPVRVPMKPKKTKKETLQWQTGIRSDHPRCRIEIPFGMVGGLPAVVISFKFHQHWTSGYRAVRGRNLADLIRLLKPMAYTASYSRTATIIFKSSITFPLYHLYFNVGKFNAFNRSLYKIFFDKSGINLVALFCTPFNASTSILARRFLSQ